MYDWFETVSAWQTVPALVTTAFVVMFFGGLSLVAATQAAAKVRASKSDRPK